MTEQTRFQGSTVNNQLATEVRQVPVGYKQTEVGVIPEDWSIARVSEVVKDHRLPSGIYKDKRLYGTGTKIIKLGDVFNFDIFIPECAQRVQLLENEIRAYKVEVGDIFLALASVKLEGVGKVMLVKELDEPTAYDHNVALIRVTAAIQSDYVAYLFKSEYVRKLVAQNATQVGTSFLKASTILGFALPIPFIIEQTAIAKALSDVDALIRELEKLIAKKQAIKTATMQQLLTGRTRLPQFALREDGTPKGTKPSELGEIPEDWVAGYTKELIGKMTSGLSRRLADNDIGMPVLISGNIQNYKLETDNLKYWYKNDPQGANTDDYVLNDGDILLCFINSLSQIGKPCIFRDIGRPTIYTTNLFRIVISDYSNSVFVYYLFSTEYFQKNLQTIAKIAVNQASFTKPDFLNSKIVYPPSKEEQTAIATILSDMDAEIQTLEQRLSKTRQIKQGMMQELLTGKTRLVQPLNKESQYG